jgi:predicted lipid-binding transport protein (Tim44 family)
MIRMIRFRPLLALAAIVAVLALIAVQSDARPRGSFGSRGSQTYSAPPPTATAPRAAQPIQRSMTQPGQAAQPSAAAATRPAAQTAGAGGFFNRPGLLGGLAAGFLGAGLFGLLAGQGMFGNLGGLASFLGLLFQAGLVAMVIWLAWSWYKRRTQQAQPAYAGAGGGPMMRQSNIEPMRSGLGSGLGLGGGSPQPGAARESGHDEVGITPQDFDAFESLLTDVQTAYGREDLGVLRSRLTPEMLSYFSEELSANASRGIENQISNVKLEQGDLAEAWREGDMEYATVAMRYSLVDRSVERASGRLVEGSDAPVEATEIWTFVRARGGNWLLSAIQQTE